MLRGADYCPSQSSALYWGWVRVQLLSLCNYHQAYTSLPVAVRWCANISRHGKHLRELGKERHKHHRKFLSNNGKGTAKPASHYPFCQPEDTKHTSILLHERACRVLTVFLRGCCQLHRACHVEDRTVVEATCATGSTQNGFGGSSHSSSSAAERKAQLGWAPSVGPYIGVCTEPRGMPAPTRELLLCTQDTPVGSVRFLGGSLGHRLVKCRTVTYKELHIVFVSLEERVKVICRVQWHTASLEKPHYLV